MRTRSSAVLLMLLLAPFVVAAKKNKKPKKPPQPSPLEQYINQATAHGLNLSGASPGSIWSPASHFMDLGSDVRASQVDDLVTVIVAEQASALAQGTTKTQRQSSLNAGITAAGGPTKAAGALANLAALNSQSALNGQGATTRTTTLSTTLSARVVGVLPNGYLVIEGSKAVNVNSEDQVVTLRGVVRPSDLTTGNTISSTQVAEMELTINGKGVVTDSVRRPFVLWRALMGILPF
jgi:flagellar L-ring protein precursor FlgH